VTAVHKVQPEVRLHPLTGAGDFIYRNPNFDPVVPDGFLQAAIGPESSDHLIFFKS
jgi:hypothetical protein